MKPTGRIFISDIHLGIGETTDWYQKEKHDANLISLLNYVADNHHTVKDLVLLGDIFDTWLCPMEQHPPLISHILEFNSNIIEALCNCVGKLQNVYYLNGNHDMHVTQADLNDITQNGKMIKQINEYRAGAIYAVHGHKFAMFNAKDHLHDPAFGYPLGYYISRLLAGDDQYTKPGAIASYIDDLLEAAVTTQSIAESVIEALMEYRQKQPSDEFIMPHGRRISIREVQKRYVNLFQRWVEKFGFWYTLQSIKGEMGSLGWFADRLCTKKDYKVVIMGHTHDAKQDVDKFVFNKDRIYANSGFWCGADNPTYVKVDKQEGLIKVALMALDNSTHQIITEAQVE